MKENGTGAKKYVEVSAVLELADGFFADPILRIATRSLLAAAPAAEMGKDRSGTEKDQLTKLLMDSPSLCTLYGTPESYADEADWLLDEGVAVPVRCKDCKRYMTIHCTCDGCCISGDWYCADGERKDNVL